MTQKKNIFSAILYKQGDKLVHINPADNPKYKDFIKNLQDNQKVEIFLDAFKDDGTIAQLAKIHACIKELSAETGSSFEDMKLTIKHKSGMCMKKIVDGEAYMLCKSFGDCSKEELSLVINTIIEIGDMCNMDLR